MENNNYNENNNANTNSTGTDNMNADSVNQNSVADTSADQGRQESSSSYGYSYINQEHKNPNNIWRADENTAHGYGSTYGSSQTYSNGSYQSQTDAGSAYGQNNTGSTYGGQTNAGSSGTQSNVNGTYNAYDQSYTASGSAYGSQAGSAYGQTDAGSAYNQAQTNAGGTYNQAQANAGSAYNQSQTGAGSTQPGSENNYSSIYGSADAQGSFQSYADAKKQKKEERARKRAEKRAGSSTGFGVKLAKCASIALVFGLVSAWNGWAGRVCGAGSGQGSAAYYRWSRQEHGTADIYGGQRRSGRNRRRSYAVDRSHYQYEPGAVPEFLWTDTKL